MRAGQIKGDGSVESYDGGPMLPDGVFNTAAGGNDVRLDEELEKKLNTLLEDELGTDEDKAQFKLEVVFAESRSKMKPYAGMVFAWTNGGFAHGGGDEAVYFCTGQIEKNGETKTCNAPLDLKFISKEVAVCPVCRNALKPKDLTGQIFARLSSQNWARLITRMFVLLNADADIRMGMMPGELRTASEIEQDQSKAGDVLNNVRLQRHWVRYPLVDIIKDTSNGASLQKRIRVFLEA